MSAEWGHGYHTGSREGFADGKALEKTATAYMVASQMRVILCALITAHQRDDHNAFWATVEIGKKTLSSYANFSEEDWRVFRGPPAQSQTK